MQNPRQPKWARHNVTSVSANTPKNIMTVVTHFIRRNKDMEIAIGEFGNRFDKVKEKTVTESAKQTPYTIAPTKWIHSKARIRVLTSRMILRGK